ncbi:MAG: InlB B-repeat-containing protein, partial [Clostridiales bacterium]|nr:InlB B-repeat-containing protein [Clostridiales bacterium]
ACTAGGYTTHTCSVCGDSYVDSETSALGHDWDGGVVTVAAACEEDGLMTYSCSRCSATKTEAIPAAGHSYLSVVTPPACTAGGCTTHTCSACGDSYVDSEIPALGHAWDGGAVTVAAACEADGLMTYSCLRCSATKTEAIPATGHSYLSVVTPPACTAGGYTTHTCSVCSNSFIDSETSALGHDWDGGVVTVAAACEADGLMTYSCSRCSAARTEAIPATGHDYVAGAPVPPTYTSEGYTLYTCSHCGISYKSDWVDRLADLIVYFNYTEKAGGYIWPADITSGQSIAGVYQDFNDWEWQESEGVFWLAKWYTDPSREDQYLYDFSEPVTGSFTLYAKWTLKGAPQIVSFNYTEKAGGYIWQAPVPTGQSIAEVYENYNEWEWQDPDGVVWLVKWYTDPGCESQYLYDFDALVTGSFTLYAKWTLK